MTDEHPLDADPETARQAQEAAPPDPHEAGLDPQEAHGGSMAPGLVDDTGHQIAEDPRP
jgi:hypothetical protein